MKLIKTLREKSQNKRLLDIQRMAADYITLSDFNGCLYISFQGCPLVPVKDDWSPKQIVEELNKVRQNFVESKAKGF